jgi:hypothetical protein
LFLVIDVSVPKVSEIGSYTKYDFIKLQNLILKSLPNLNKFECSAVCYILHYVYTDKDYDFIRTRFEKNCIRSTFIVNNLNDKGKIFCRALLDSNIPFKQIKDTFLKEPTKYFALFKFKPISSA